MKEISFPKHFYIKTMGCQMNAYDSDSLAQAMIKDGISPVNTPENADIILLNTCAVRAKPEQKAYSFLGRMFSIKKENPDLILGVIGCLAQMKALDLIKRFPEIDFILGPRELGRFQEVLKTVEIDHGRIVAAGSNPAPLRPEHGKGYFEKRVAGYVSIMEGCNNFCSYCIVPYVRGREISRSPHEILIEVENLLTAGIKEITLLGQNVNSYLWDGRDKKWNFRVLLDELSRLDRLLRLRFTTSHPKDLSDDLIHSFHDIRKLCPHIHLPFQAGSNRILKLMRRGYTREAYLELIKKLRQVKPGIAITSDVMVGFPGEMDEDFELTLDLLRNVEFDSLFSFKYSDRSGTSAEAMNNKIRDSVKAARLSVLQDLQKEITLKKNKELEGKRLEVLVEGKSKRGGQLTGRTVSNKVVNFNGNNSLIGSLVTVNIKRSFLNSLRAELT
ncbi:MAG: tRNA (N6-isopentenyl adenosine(37)-C2)-methylthiotransferase MiaB [Proteobacteria bacterium]|nr:tRNA (N6-isopentenyl adenosine(37)-C2)-methylthiotransferase MiaB [Pseudomonadota bacterium]